MNRIMAFFLSLVTVFTGFQTSLINKVFDCIVSISSGIPFLESSVSDDFIDDIGSSDVKLDSHGNGYYKRLMMLFIDDDTSVLTKSKIFGKYQLTLLGWFCAADMYVVSCTEKDFNSIKSLGEKIESENSAVLKATPITTVSTSPDTTPDDPFESAETWSYENESSDRWGYDAIDLREAWNYSEYFNNIKIGIVDCGFNANHEDLKGKISFPSKREEKNNIADSHGTFVAGELGAIADNGKGVTGICEKSELVCVDWEAVNDQNWNNTLHVFFGFCRLVTAGAKVINLSLGISPSYSNEDSEADTSRNLLAGICSALMSILLGKGNDFIVVESAGNGDADNIPIDSFANGYFCSIKSSNAVSVFPGVSKSDLIDRVITVASAEQVYDEGYRLSWFSNIGDLVDIAAPGSNIYGLDEGDGSYCYKSGTSMAAPMVTGVASLVWSVNESLSGADVRNIVVQSTDKIAYDEDGQYSYPMLNAKLAVEAALKTKYSLTKLTGTVICPDVIYNDDCIEITINGKSKTVTTKSGVIDLLVESGDADIKSLLFSDVYSYDDLNLPISGEKTDLGEILWKAKNITEPTTGV